MPPFSSHNAYCANLREGHHEWCASASCCRWASGCGVRRLGHCGHRVVTPTARKCHGHAGGGAPLPHSSVGDGGRRERGTAARYRYDPGGPYVCVPRGAIWRGVDPHCTPGATDPRVTQANITVTVCAKGYTSRVRPPVEETDHAKRLLMLAYGSTGSAHGYELDHLIPLELGGSSDVRNLWPEPGASPNPKDAVENQLRDMVCAQVWGIGGPALPLAVAQRLISADWTSAISQARK